MSVKNYFKDERKMAIKFFLGTFLTLAIVLLVFYLWNEDLSIEHKINHEKFASYFSGLTFIAAIVSIYFLYKQITEMQITYSPSIYPFDADLLIKDMSDYYENLYLKISNENLNPLRKNIDESNFEICNIGTGPAKNILIEWIYDMEKVIIYNSGNYVIDPKSKPEIERILFLPKDGKIKIKVPVEFLFCYGNLNNKYMFGRLGELEDKRTDEKPELSLKISCFDIRSKLIESDFQVSFKAIKHRNAEMENISIVSVNFSQIN